MAFDWTKVDGYREDMSAEEKLSLLNDFEMPEPEKAEPQGKPMVSKTMYDKVASELASAKKQLRSRMTSDEAAEADRAAKLADMQAELDQLRKEKSHSTYKASYLAQGYDESLAEEAASAMIEGDSDGLFAAMRKHAAAAEKALRAQILKDTPVPPASDEADEAALKEKKEMAIMRESMGLPPI